MLPRSSTWKGQHGRRHAAARDPRLQPREQRCADGSEVCCSWMRRSTAPPATPRHRSLWFPSLRELTGTHKQGNSAEVMELAGKSQLSRTLSFPKGVIYLRPIQLSKDMPANPVCGLAARGSPEPRQDAGKTPASFVLIFLKKILHQRQLLPPILLCESEHQEPVSKDTGKGYRIEL